MENLEKQAKSESDRIKQLLNDCNVPESRIYLLESIIENVSWMKVKLDEARELIKKSSVAIPYDNGGGQKGVRQNPIFSGYESLFKSYMAGMGKILECLPKDVAEQAVEVEKPKSVLELVRDKHKKEA